MLTSPRLSPSTRFGFVGRSFAMPDDWVLLPNPARLLETTEVARPRCLGRWRPRIFRANVGTDAGSRDEASKTNPGCGELATADRGKWRRQTEGRSDEGGGRCEAAYAFPVPQSSSIPKFRPPFPRSASSQSTYTYFEIKSHRRYPPRSTPFIITVRKADRHAAAITIIFESE
ncbi:hypothetical protein DL765_004176 [Monosporascus sp. GIB2]|nr:hypothetical protein DL765_004176 [Monosporascus sp. GIB2]